MPDRRVGSGLQYVQDLETSRDTDALIRMLASPSFAGSRSSVRASAAQALGRLGDKSAGPALVQALDDPDDRVRFYATDALLELPYIAAGPRLIDCLEDDSRLVRLTAAKAVGRFVVAEARPALQRAIRSDDRWLRLRAAEGL